MRAFLERFLQFLGRFLQKVGRFFQKWREMEWFWGILKKIHALSR